MKKKKYLPLYYKWMDNGGWMPDDGLCKSIGVAPIKLFKPTAKEYFRDGTTNNSSVDNFLWASDGVHPSPKERTRRWHERKFTPLRQNIVLLLACMAEEY